MSEGLARAIFVTGAALFAAAGCLHALGALIDTRRPTFFRPVDRSVIPAMESTWFKLRVVFPGRPSGRENLWRAWLGFNISHGVGVAFFGTMLIVLATHDFGLVTEIGAVRPLSIGVGLVYVLLSVRFWFYLPAIATGLGTLCFVVTAVA